MYCVLHTDLTGSDVLKKSMIYLKCIKITIPKKCIK